MAYSRRKSGTRRAGPRRSTSGRTTYRSRAVRRPARRRATGRRAASGGRTIRLEIVTSANPLARPEMIGQMQAPAPRKALF